MERREGGEMREQVKWFDEKCPSCDRRINSWDRRLSKALGYKQTVCESCIAEEYDVSVNELRETAEHHFGLTPCFGI